MSKLTIEGVGTVDVAADARLSNALIANGGDPLHRCGGNARCTTCRVEFLAGEPDQITVAEKAKLSERGLLEHGQRRRLNYLKAEKAKLSERGLLGQVRLSCQIMCHQDMHVKVLSPFGSSGLADAGPDLATTITPSPEWTTK